jgi:Xaa-Pro aminopeptidase
MQPFVHRRERLAQQIRERGGGVAVVFTAPEALRNRDSEYPYRWDSYFYYLCGFPEPEAVLVMAVTAEKTESLLFCRDKNPEREIWDGYRFGPAAAAQRFGFDAAHPISELDEKLPRRGARPGARRRLGAVAGGRHPRAARRDAPGQGR